MLRDFAWILLLGTLGCAPAGKGDMGEPGEAGPMGTMGAMGSAGAPGPGAQVKEVVGTGQLMVTAATTTFTPIPGLLTTIDVPDGLVVALRTEGGVQCAGTGSAYAAVDIAIFVDGLQTTAIRRIVAANTAGVAQVVTNWSIGRTLTLAAGIHTVDVRAVSADPGAATANVSSAAAPQLQGVLTAMFLAPAS